MSTVTHYTLTASLLCATISVPFLYADSKKVAEDQRIELLRGLSAERATAKAPIPRSPTPLDFGANGEWDKKRWEQIGSAAGPAARVGDLVLITKVTIGKDAIILELNNGARGHWYDNAQLNDHPLSNMPTEAPGGTSIAVRFFGGIGNVTSGEVKKLLAPVLNFNYGSVTELSDEELPPEIKKAVQDKKAIVGMNRDQVILALGRPNRKVRETEDGVEIEDWIYGEPPGRMTFVTFAGKQVSKVKETYAGLGGSIADIPKQP
jgi:hypothetical protein